MAEVELTSEKITRGGLEATYNAISTEDTYKADNNGRMALHFKKTGAGAAVITIVTPGTVDGLAIADRTFTVPATTGDVFEGPLPRGNYNDASGQIEFSTSEDTGLTCALLRI